MKNSGIQETEKKKVRKGKKVTRKKEGREELTDNAREPKRREKETSIMRKRGRRGSVGILTSRVAENRTWVMVSGGKEKKEKKE